MSHFLKNLIARHQSEGGSQNVSHIVQPRPKSRFETGSGFELPLALAQDNSTIEPITGTASIPSSEIRQTPVHHYPTTGKNNQGPGCYSNDETELTGTSSLKSEGKSSTQETSSLPTPDRSYQQHKEHNELDQNTEQPNNQHLSVSDSLNTHIQIILQRLNSEQNQRSDNHASIENGENAQLLNTASVINQNQATRSEAQHVVPGEILDLKQVDSPRKHSTENQPGERAEHQSGVLQIPNWLRDMQSDITNRLQGIRNQEKTEPVVNVTIGRIEVRAIQTDSVKPAIIQNKPSGVMSLDDYLKHRDKVRP